MRTSSGVPDRAEGRIKLSCPRCRLTLYVRSALLSVDYCPRCLARARTATPLQAAAAKT
ncbi:MAG TPA: hypothetical protein VIC05_04120 [Solirubrobacteraceae bacterium]|jgi:hypothetical protein